MPTGGVRVASNDTAAEVNKSGRIARDLDFTAVIWNTEQTITVSAVEDVDMGSETVALTHLTVNVDDENLGLTVFPQATTMREGSATGNAYTVTLHTQPSGPVTGRAATELPVTVTDPDTGVTMSRRAVTVVAGGTNTYTVGLTVAGPVTVTASSSAASVATVGSAGSRAVVFTMVNWRMPPVTGRQR